MLYFASYMSSIFKYGALIMYLHDLADIPVAATKMFAETKFKPLTVVSGLTMDAVWAYTRLYVFP